MVGSCNILVDSSTKKSRQAGYFRRNHYRMLLEILGGHPYRFVSEIRCRFSLRLASTGSPAYMFKRNIREVVPQTMVS